jgi:selenophosphate synthase
LTPALDDAYTSGQLACLRVMGALWAQGAQPASLVCCVGCPDGLDTDIMEHMVAGVEACAAQVGCAVQRGSPFDAAQPQLALSVVGAREAASPAVIAPGDALFLLGRLGAGVLDAAGDGASARRVALANAWSAQLGPQLVALGGVALVADARAGLLGQALALCRAAQLDARLWTSALPCVPELPALIARGVGPRGAAGVWERLGGQVRLGHELWRGALCDPLPGGLLVAAAPEARAALERLWGAPLPAVGAVAARAGGGARVVVVQAR